MKLSKTSQTKQTPFNVAVKYLEPPVTHITPVTHIHGYVFEMKCCILDAVFRFFIEICITRGLAISVFLTGSYD